MGESELVSPLQKVEALEQRIRELEIRALPIGPRPNVFRPRPIEWEFTPEQQEKLKEAIDKARPIEDVPWAKRKRREFVSCPE